MAKNRFTCTTESNLYASRLGGYQYLSMRVPAGLDTSFRPPLVHRLDPARREGPPVLQRVGGIFLVYFLSRLRQRSRSITRGGAGGRGGTAAAAVVFDMFDIIDIFASVDGVVDIVFVFVALTAFAFIVTAGFAFIVTVGFAFIIVGLVVVFVVFFLAFAAAAALFGSGGGGGGKGSEFVALCTVGGGFGSCGVAFFAAASVAADAEEDDGCCCPRPAAPAASPACAPAPASAPPDERRRRGRRQRPRRIDHDPERPLPVGPVRRLAGDEVPRKVRPRFGLSGPSRSFPALLSIIIVTVTVVIVASASNMRRRRIHGAKRPTATVVELLANGPVAEFSDRFARDAIDARRSVFEDPVVNDKVVSTLSRLLSLYDCILRSHTATCFHKMDRNTVFCRRRLAVLLFFFFCSSSRCIANRYQYKYDHTIVRLSCLLSLSFFLRVSSSLSLSLSYFDLSFASFLFPFSLLFRPFFRLPLSGFGACYFAVVSRSRLLCVCVCVCVCVSPFLAGVGPLKSRR